MLIWPSVKMSLTPQSQTNDTPFENGTLQKVKLRTFGFKTSSNSGRFIQTLFSCLLPCICQFEGQSLLQAFEESAG